MSTNQTSGAPATQPPEGEDDDEQGMFFVALGSFVLGTLSFLAWAVLTIAEKFGNDPSALSIFAHRQWFLIAAVGLVVLGVMLQIHRIGEFVSQRRSAVFLNVVLMTILALALTVLANYVGARHFKEFDWTRTNIYSISDESVQVVATLQKPIKMWVVWPSSDGNYELVRRLLDHYRSKSEKVSIEHVDPEAGDMAKFERQIKLLGLDDRTWEDAVGVVVQSGSADEKGEWKADKSKHVGMRDLFESSFDPMSGQRGQKKFKGEGAITNAIIEVSEPTKPKIFFLTGHKESDLEGQNQQSPKELGYFSKILRQKNYDVSVLDLMKPEAHPVPDNCSVLVIAGPETSFFPQEVTAIETYLKNGGAALFLMGPNIHANRTNDGYVWEKVGLENTLKMYNVALPDQMLFLLTRGGATDQCLVTWFDAESKVTSPLASSNGRAMFLGARPITVLKENPHAKVTELARTVELTYAVADIAKFENDATPDGDHKAWPVLVSIEEKHEGPPSPDEKDKDKKKKDTKIIVAGDVHWMSNPLVASPGTRNEPLALNCIAWLVGQERFSKEPAKEASYKLDMSQGLVDVYSTIALLGMPVFAIILSISVFLIRRR